jgi:tetratricopeptide (TPR) repeat protein
VTTETAEELFERGRNLLKDGNTLSALACFERSFSVRELPGIKSYIGVCAALERGQINDALVLCAEAISEEPENPVHYLHMGRVYLKAGIRSEAIAAMRKGLSFADNEEIRSLLDNLGTRKKPVIPFLPRNNLLNKYAGILLRRLRLR